jgi:hypothetical protein
MITLYARGGLSIAYKLFILVQPNKNERLPRPVTLLRPGQIREIPKRLAVSVQKTPVFAILIELLTFSQGGLIFLENCAII